MAIERRYITHEVRAVGDDSPKIEGYAVVFGVRSQDLGGWFEVIAPTAFDASLASPELDAAGLFNHDSSKILGRTSSKTMIVTKDETGVFYSIDPPDTTYARDLIVSLKRGDVHQSSFGFICTDSVWGYDEVTGAEIRTVKQATLVDCSPVTFPAYLQSSSGVRTLPGDMPGEVRSRIEARTSKPTDAPPPPATDQRDADPDTCQCDCPQCAEGACGICSDDNCTDANCDCQDSRSQNKLTELRRKVDLALIDLALIDLNS